MNKLSLYIRTLRHLTATQIAYRALYALKNRVTSSDYNILKPSKHQFPSWPNKNPKHFITNPIILSTSTSTSTSTLTLTLTLTSTPALSVAEGSSSTSTSTLTFTFLNLTHTFKSKIDWNYSGHKKLWTYNLNYFDYLLQEELSKETGLQLIHQYIKDFTWIKDGKEPYPTSLRIINWVKFCLIHQIEDNTIKTAILNQTKHLSQNLEYHILGNHLLENAFALFVGSAYTADAKRFNKGKKLLTQQLNEQILADGAHYERSPMYHQIILGRLLDTIQLLNQFSADRGWIAQLNSFASPMLGWMITMAFSKTHMPLLKDAANNIAPNQEALFEIAQNLQIEPTFHELNESGYRKMRFSDFEVLVDIGNMTPSYQPGHAHADTFNYELYHAGVPVIVDTGTSTYNPGSRRTIERSTAAHNTVAFCNHDSSEVWASHRVGRRAEVTILTDETNSIIAQHNGYAHLGVIHKRSFISRANSFLIEDEMISQKKKQSLSRFSTARLHFHPERNVQLNNNELIIDNLLVISFLGLKKVTLNDFSYAPEFNKLIPSKVCEIEFEQKLTTEIKTISKK